MGLKKNVLYSTFLAGSNYIFPLITYPYISRVLGVENIGICNFVISLISYFLLFSTMGLNTIGIRETAKYKGDKEKMSTVFSSIFALNFISTLIVLAVYISLVIWLPALQPYRDLLFIGTVQIMFTTFLIEWFYKGMEDFKYITIRSLFVKVLYVVAIFVFIKYREDYVIYFALTISSSVLNAIFNWNYKKKHVSLSFKNINIRPYIKPFFILGVYAILTSMYISFNVVYLGFITNTTEVGYYTTATKLFGIMLAFFTAFSAVMMPRISSMLVTNDIESVKKLIYKSFELIFPLALTLILFCGYFTPEIVLMLSGKGYEGAIIPMRIILPLILVIGIEQILVVQLLVPMKEDKAILFNSIAGAVVGIGLNLLLVKHFMSTGSAFVWLGAEFTVFISAFYFVRKKIGQVIPLALLAKNVAILLPLLGMFIYLKMIDIQPILLLAIAGLLTLIYVLITQKLILKNSILRYNFKFNRS